MNRNMQVNHAVLNEHVSALDLDQKAVRSKDKPIGNGQKQI